MANLRGWSFAIVFGTGAVILLTLYVASPFLASRFEVFARPRPAQETVSASATVLVRPSVAYKPPAAYHLSSLRTAVVFSYKTPIDVNDTADISATLSQDDVVELLISAPVAASGAVSNSNVDDGMEAGVYRIAKLGRPITLHLQGIGFDWDNRNDILLKAQTPLPVTEHWAPRPKAPGDYVLTFPMRDVNGVVSATAAKWDEVKIDINGKQSKVGGSDDVTLLISVYTHGVPARWFDQATLWGGVLSAALGSGFAGKALLSFLDRRSGSSDDAPARDG